MAYTRTSCAPILGFRVLLLELRVKYMASLFRLFPSPPPFLPFPPFLSLVCVLLPSPSPLCSECKHLNSVRLEYKYSNSVRLKKTLTTRTPCACYSNFVYDYSNFVHDYSNFVYDVLELRVQILKPRVHNYSDSVRKYSNSVRNL